MEISLEDFNSLSAEQSRRDVQIARLQMELESLKHLHAMEKQALQSRNDALLVQLEQKQKHIDMLSADYENMRFENHWMKQYILLSVERVKSFFTHIRNVEVLSAVKSFVLNVLPENASAEQVAYASQMMQLPMDEEEPRILIEQAGDVIADGGTKNVSGL